MKHLRLALVALSVFALVACNDDDDDNNDEANATITNLLAINNIQTQQAVATNVPNTLTSQGFTALVNAVVAQNLAATLSSGTFTVFAPTDAAFGALSSVPSNLDQVLLYHVTPGALEATDVLGAASTGLTMANSSGDSVIIDLVGSTAYINEARITRTDISASNGVIHEIDRVISPPVSVVDTLSSRGYTTLVDLVVRADSLNSSLNLATTLNGTAGLTVFVPTNAAFAAAGITNVALLTDQQVLDLVPTVLYHVVNAGSGSGVKASAAVAAGAVGTLNTGRSVTVTINSSGAPVVQGETNTPGISLINIPATNSSVIHVIDAVLLPATPPPAANG
jgi:uncharacterized surface protein with fasciclin (FAS1) repeats